MERYRKDSFVGTTLSTRIEGLMLIVCWIGDEKKVGHGVALRGDDASGQSMADGRRGIEKTVVWVPL
jgi:hypothetical protein